MTASSLVKINTVSCVDIWRKLNVHKTFRRRPVRSVCVLCLLGPSKNGWLPFFLWQNQIPYIKENHPTWKNGWLKLILRKKPVRLKEWMTGRNFSLQMEWDTTLKNWRLQVVFWPKYFVLATGGLLKKYIHHKRMEWLHVLSDIYQCTSQKIFAVTSVEWIDTFKRGLL